jgi:predicted transglutaminase-like cysteine proteinase
LRFDEGTDTGVVWVAAMFDTEEILCSEDLSELRATAQHDCKLRDRRPRRAILFSLAIAALSITTEGAFGEFLSRRDVGNDAIVYPADPARWGRSYMPLGKPMLAPIAFTRFCIRKPARCAPSQGVEQIALDSHRDELERVNRQVNRMITVVTASSNEQRWDDETSIGNCVIFALTKRLRLLDLGYPSSALLLASAIVPSGEGHLVVIVVTDQGDFALDNLQDSLVRWDKLQYRWIQRSMPNNPQYWQAIGSPLLLSESKQLRDHRVADTGALAVSLSAQ